MHKLYGRAGFGQELVCLRVGFGRSRLRWHRSACLRELPFASPASGDAAHPPPCASAPAEHPRLGTPRLWGVGARGGPLLWQPPSKTARSARDVEDGGGRNTLLPSPLSPLG